MASPVHHIELWTHDLSGVADSFDWLLAQLGWRDDQVPDWPQGRIWRHPDGLYLVLEQSPDVSADDHDRLRPGLNHLALNCAGRKALDQLRSACAEHGWRELFADSYPYAGGPDHTALFVENSQGFEIEVVAGQKAS